MKDFYTKKSRDEGYYARSVYKLKEANKRFRLIQKGDRILDLGSSPGGWIQASLELIGENGKIVGIDLSQISRIKDPRFTFIRGDIYKTEIPFTNFDVVMSDMAPKTTGIQVLDQERSADLARTALKLAEEKLKKGGNFICKIFQGPDYQEFIQEVKQKFKEVKTFKPRSSKQKSKEMYIVAKCYKITKKSKTCSNPTE